MNNVAIITIAVVSVGAMLLLHDAPRSAGAYTFASEAPRRKCPPKPYYAHSERPEYPRWERVEREPETNGSITTAFRRGSSDE